MTTVTSSLHSILNTLESDKSVIEGRILAIRKAISEFEGIRSSNCKKTHRSGSLKSYLFEILKTNKQGESLSVKDLTETVIKSGYKSKNKTLAKSVGIALAEMTKIGEIRKIKRGSFSL